MEKKDTTQIKERLKALENEVARLQKLVSSGDPEGEYKEEFVQDILDRAEDEPEFTFSDSESFKKQIQEVGQENHV